MGNIQNACIKYKNLLDKEYYFILGRKQKETYIQLNFSKIEFYHICGLHKLSDILELNNPNKSQIFDDIFDGKITSELCKKSTHYSEIDERIALIENLENFLDSNKTIFKFNNLTNTFSLIEADYILKNSDTYKNMYVFISKEGKNSNTYFCRSAFPRDKSERDYAIGHTSYTLLYKEKIDLLTNERQVLYTHPSYKKELEQPTAQSQPHQNDNIKQIKFDNPAPQNILHSSSGAAAAVLPPPNPLKGLFAKLRQGIAGLFKPKDKLSDTIPETSEETDQPEKEIISEEDKTAETEVVPEKPYSDELSELIKVRERFAAEEIELPEYGRALGIYLSTLKSKEMCEQVREILQKQLSECSRDDKRIICINTELREIKRYSNKHFSPHPKQTLDDLIEYARVEREKRDNEAMKAEPKEKQTTKSNDYYER